VREVLEETEREPHEITAEKPLAQRASGDE